MTETNTRWKVKQNTGQHAGRTLFEGLEKDARLYVEDNFPRPHFDVGGFDKVETDVHLVGPDNVREHLLDGEWHYVDEEEE